MNDLNKEIINHWKQLRKMTYDFLELISDEDMAKKLPFEKSQTLGNQFYCMVGTTETNVKYIETGVWNGWSCSLKNWKDPKANEVVEKMEKADEKLLKRLEQIDLLKKSGADGSALMRYNILAEHESHHQGQIINFIYAHNLPIPDSWTEKWGLKN